MRQSDHAADCSNKLPTFIAQVLEKSQGLSLSVCSFLLSVVVVVVVVVVVGCQGLVVGGWWLVVMPFVVSGHPPHGDQIRFAWQ